MDRVTLGQMYVDSVTGYVGTATARNEILHGSVNVCLERLGANNKVEEVWFTEPRLKEHEQPSNVGF